MDAEARSVFGTPPISILPVLHLAKDLDLIAELTGQDCERLRATSS
jgi:hypothetical protein